jgi:hypothetical protein
LGAKDTTKNVAGVWVLAIPTRPAASRAPSLVSFPARTRVRIISHQHALRYTCQMSAGHQDRRNYILTEGDGGTDTGEHEEERGDELGDVGSDGAGAKGVADGSERELHHLVSSHRAL